MNDAQKMVHDMFEAYKSTSSHKDRCKMEVACKKAELEITLDKMWAIYWGGNTAQILEYNKQVDSIKSSGYKVLRNSAGKHKIVLNN